MFLSCYRLVPYLVSFGLAISLAMTSAFAQLAEGGSSASGLLDTDLDGIPDDADNCPRLPNEPDIGDRQIALCTLASRAEVKNHVFLASRSFRPLTGLDPALVPGSAPLHVLLHIAHADEAVVLSAEQRRRLKAAGVALWDYVPYATYYASVPADAGTLAAVVNLPFVKGISAIQPRDRMARSVRLARDRASERGPDGRLHVAVEFFPDVPRKRIKSLLVELGLTPTAEDEGEWLIAASQITDVLALAESDLVYWIDALPAVPKPFDDAALSASSADIVDRVHGFRGAGLKVAMMEEYEVADGHPDLAGRITHDSAGSDGFNGHNLEVAGILIGDGTGDDTKRGFLPEATLIDFSSRAFPRTNRHWYYRYPKQARNHHDAVVFNYSNGGEENCNTLGEYGSAGKNLDKAVQNFSISVVRAAGNTRGPIGTLAKDRANGGPKHGPCETNLGSLPAEQAKNAISVGNWSLVQNSNCAQSGAVCGTSAAGPTLDDRLKPDVVAPGEGVWTTSLEGAGFGYREFHGTSAAAPVTSGVIGQIYEAFDHAAVPRAPLSIPPSTIKAALVHTARDVGPRGPDYFTGWGLIDAAAAVRLALNHDQATLDDELFLYEGRLDETAPLHSQNFEVTGTIYGVKVTLVWDDPPAANSASRTLINDLDLTVTDGAGQVHYPFDTKLTNQIPSLREQEALQGAKDCNSIFCRDDRNTVEQVVITDPAGVALPTGTWTATVSGMLAEPEQSFSLVVETGECPLRIYASTTLGANVACPYEELAPVAISIERDDVVLDCAGRHVVGTGVNVDGYQGRYTGIQTGRDRVTVRNCTIEDFDIGVDFKNNAAGVIDTVTTQTVGSAGIRVSGSGHTITHSTVSSVFNPDGRAISAAGDQHNVLNSSVVPQSRPGSSLTTGIYLTGPSEGPSGQIFRNNVNFAGNGIVVDASSETGIHSYDIRLNTIGNASLDGIRVIGALVDSTINSNVIERFGTNADAGLRLEATANRIPSGNTISGNIIMGQDQGSQYGIYLQGFRWQNLAQLDYIAENVIRLNKIGLDRANNPFPVTTGIYEDLGSANQIIANIIRSKVAGIHTHQSLADPSAAIAHVQGNNIADPDTGVSVTSFDNAVQLTTARVTGNTISNVETGITIEQTKSGKDISASGNRITLAPAGKEGIAVTQGDSIVISNNEVSNAIAGSGQGVVVSLLQEATIAGNLLQGLGTGVVVDSTPSATLVNNEFSGVTHGVSLGAGVTSVSVQCNKFANTTFDFTSVNDVDASYNAWSELGTPSGQIDDNDGDGFGEAGADWLFSSVNYGGPRLAIAKLTSTKTEHLSDDLPWTDTTVACPPP